MIILANNKKIPVINIPVNNFVNTGYQFRQYWLMILSILVFDFKGKQTEDSKNMGVLEICLHQISNEKNAISLHNLHIQRKYAFSHSFVFHKA